MATTLRVQIPDKIRQRLGHLAEKTKRPVSFHIENVLGLYLDEYEEACLALNRSSEKNARYYTSEDVRRLLEL